MPTLSLHDPTPRLLAAVAETFGTDVQPQPLQGNSSIYTIESTSLPTVVDQAINWTKIQSGQMAIDTLPIISDGSVDYPDTALGNATLEFAVTCGVPLVITHHVFWQLSHVGKYDLRLVAQLPETDYPEPISVFEVFNGDRPASKMGKQDTKTQFEQALFLYFLGFYTEARCSFADCLKQNPADQVAAYYIERCRECTLGPTANGPRLQSQED